MGQMSVHFRRVVSFVFFTTLITSAVFAQGRRQFLGRYNEYLTRPGEMRELYQDFLSNVARERFNLSPSEANFYIPDNRQDLGPMQDGVRILPVPVLLSATEDQQLHAAAAQLSLANSVCDPMFISVP